jgi:(E)-4-hydroxy-3-methylbut-2-enyl-diphosphate synthase
MLFSYCTDLNKYQRRSSDVVVIGGIPMGDHHPIRIQSMTNTPTSDIRLTVGQIQRIFLAGADYVRLTIPSLKDTESLKQIVHELRSKNCRVPIIADVHFSPAIARITAGIADKVRINPGNYTDKKKSNLVVYTDEEYQHELLELEQQFLPLLDICKGNKTVLRIGTNHGSLSDRIMSCFGDTPQGMVESAMEFLRICTRENFDQVVVSMKASNTRTMVYATRLLVKRMSEENMHFPLHLGVTEAGEGEDGRIRSAIGIGALLADGLGDTVRVSLTEEPEAEIPVALKLVKYFEERANHAAIPTFGNYPVDPYEYHKRLTHSTGNVGRNNPVVVVSGILGSIDREKLKNIGWDYSGKDWHFSDLSADILSVDSWPAELPIPGGKYVMLQNKSLPGPPGLQYIVRMNWEEYVINSTRDEGMLCVCILASQLDKTKIQRITDDRNVILVLETNNINGFADQRAAVCRMINLECSVPVILKRSYNEYNLEDFQIKSACDLGGLFIDGLGEGIWLENQGDLQEDAIMDTAFSILQFSRVRISKTEYISCPSCGRTLFDLQTITRKIREKTSHLKGLKIGIMGCIVNGPGEMADADYGYVGTGIGKITLYKEKAVVKRNIPEEQAVDELITLIKENGDWVEP